MKAVLVAAVAAAMLVTGCTSDLLFEQSTALQITSPHQLGRVHEPVTITWRAPSGSRVAVFVDATPMAPGARVDAHAQRPDQVLFTDADSVTLQRLQPNPGADSTERNHHEVDVVVVDARGRRIGEAAAFVEFQVVT